MERSPPQDQLTLTVLYKDEHLIELQCSVIFGEWSGIVSTYADHDSLGKLAQMAQKFCENSQDSVSWEIGKDDDDGAGCIRLQLYRIDSAGHVRCHVKLASKAYATSPAHRPNEIRRFAIEVPTEPWQITVFSKELAHIAENLEGQATLMINQRDTAE